MRTRWIYYLFIQIGIHFCSMPNAHVPQLASVCLCESVSGPYVFISVRKMFTYKVTKVAATVFARRQWFQKFACLLPRGIQSLFCEYFCIASASKPWIIAFLFRLRKNNLLSAGQKKSAGLVVFVASGWLVVFQWLSNFIVFFSTFLTIAQ